jgi:hypothetical protein
MQEAEGLLSCLSSYSQIRETITDPEIEFSVEVPKGWLKYDDGYTYLLIIPSEFGDENLSLTYFLNEDTCLQKDFDISVKTMFPLNIPGYKLLSAGDNIIDKQSAKWAIFTSTINGTEYKSILYMFYKHRQAFTIQGTTRKQNFNIYVNDFEAVIKSLRIKKLEKDK